METPRTMIPGPTTPSHDNPFGDGGIGSSARIHGASPEADSGATVSLAGFDAEVVTGRLILQVPKPRRKKATGEAYRFVPLRVYSL
jgi:hypothetical protein